MNNLILFGLSLCNFITGLLFLKYKKQENILEYKKIFIVSIILLNLLIFFIPLSFVKKCFAVLLISPLLYQFFLDIKTMELSDVLSGVVLGYGILFIIITKQPENIISALILFGIYSVFSLLGPMGFGDVKLVTGLGLFINNYILMVFYPFLISVIIEVFLRLLKIKNTNEFAFGPYMVIGFYLILIFFENFLNIF